ncbi:flagellar FlbD family protein [Actinotalea caeni]|uniref:flagellar FlbD family protein n=1 Tax=Actinotalea caeni TaxID=1348467 RepID=UPI0012E2834C|nr:flagellar FlbD family protein [Actinotalea caeni]
MIHLTRLNASAFVINPDLVERIYANPDTTLVMVDGTTFIVAETMHEVIDRIIDFRAAVVARARDLPPASRQLGLVPRPPSPSATPRALRPVEKDA